MLKRILLSVAIAAAVATSASAADLSRKAPAAQPYYAAPVSWGGFYIGANGGYGWSQSQDSIGGANALGSAVVSSGFVPGSLDTHSSGAVAGIQAGYNWQFGQIVAGPEADLDWSGIKGSASQSLGIGPLGLTTNASTKLEWFGDVRLRAGYLVTADTLLYGTAGFAYGKAESTNSIALAAGPFSTSASNDASAVKTGWIAGAGIEQRINQSLSIKAEYDYMDLGSIGDPLNATVARTPVNFTTSQPLRYNLVRAGINYHF